MSEKIVDEFRESEVASHAYESETSRYLAINPDRVKMDKAERDHTVPMRPDFKNPVRLTE
jgi:creatinine amidohydrolase/Fe(II)-dependent formamide hydrolase-like protein